jgi:beta-galactosidase
MRALLSSEYVPFGSQYYRAPSPPPSEWEKDLSAFARLGFNTVKFWVQWRWNNPREGKFYFDDIDRLMDIAQANRLRVMLNTIVDVAPVWIYQKYPDASMVTLDGRRIGPQVQPHRQIGGLGCCFNHAPAMEQLFEFLRTTVRRYKDHPALEMWNVASEPELTSSMAEMRLYAENADKMGDMLCYCGRCQELFRNWLAEKYHSVDALNLSWNRNYGSFGDAEVPRTRNSYNDMVDWRMFFVYTLGQNVRRRFEVARSEDGGKHPLMCHHVFIQGFPVTSTASDPWNVGQYGDLHAITQMDDPMMCDVLRSCAKGRPVMSAEMLMMFGYTLDLPKPIGANDVRRYVFNGVAAGLKGSIFWQYRPETLAREAPAWGLTRLDGSSTPWLESYAEVNRVIQKNAALLLAAQPRKAEIAILYSPENQIFGWAATGNEKNVTDALLGTHKALYERNFSIDFIHPREFAGDILSSYKVVYIPFPYFLSERICAALEAWVRDGGVLIGESYFAGWHVEMGRHHTTVPGYGLHRVFQARQLNASPPDAGGSVGIIMTSDLPHIRRGTRVVGAMVKESFVSEGAEIWGTFETGEPAVTCGRYGKGYGMLIGTYVGMPFYRNGIQSNGDLIASLVEAKAVIPRPVVVGEEKVRVDVLTGPDGRVFLIARNLEQAPVDCSFHVPGLRPGTLVEQFGRGSLVLTPAERGAAARIMFQPGEVKVYCE